MAENHRRRSLLPLLLHLQQFDDGDHELLAAAVFAYIGRSSVPARERMPVTGWSSKDLLRNVWRGLDLCSANTPLRRVLDGPTSQVPTK